MHRPVLLLVTLLVPAAAAPSALARDVVLKDREGRTMTFDVRSTGVDVSWYADLLRNAPHGDEISRVTIRIVPFATIRSACGAEAGGCYRDRGGRAVMYVPAGQTDDIAHTVVHEYGHHVDQAHDHGGLPEPNGTSLWWKARGMAALVRSRSVARSYRLGWDRSIGEIFAEDYAQVSLRTPTRIRWLAPPWFGSSVQKNCELGVCAQGKRSRCASSMPAPSRRSDLPRCLPVCRLPQSSSDGRR